MLHNLYSPTTYDSLRPCNTGLAQKQCVTESSSLPSRIERKYSYKNEVVTCFKIKRGKQKQVNFQEKLHFHNHKQQHQEQIT